MKQEVITALEDIEKQFRGRTKKAADKGGGAFVIVEEAPLGSPFDQPNTWVGFHITHNHPYADVYPHFVRGDLTRTGQGISGEGFSTGQQFPQPDALLDPSEMPSRPAIQISRRSNRRDPSGLETPLIKLLKVLEWLRAR